ncbi:hypothetical protein B4087_1924 [Bacillus cereus]|nr:hypothetical protein B4087_1924 [Bacillus cereus]KZD82567.1 hypothetical protein B4155_2428 [Bacillus cereus]KZD82641.1 hypothetical protein B4120_1528 [Bacillus cereus]
MDNSASLICVETGLLIEVSASGGETNWYDVDEKFTMGFSVGNDVTVTWNEIVTVVPAVIVPIFTPFTGFAPL